MVETFVSCINIKVEKIEPNMLVEIVELGTGPMFGPINHKNRSTTKPGSEPENW